MIIEWARTGTHSASAIFREARSVPALRHAVATAPRDWWKNATRAYGRRRWVVRTKRAIREEQFGTGTYSVPAWETIVPKEGAGNFHDAVFVGWVKRTSDGESTEMAFAHPYDVFSAAAREWGLVCVSCAAPERADRWTGDQWHLCGACNKPRRDETAAHVALRLFEKAVKQAARQERAS